MGKYTYKHLGHKLYDAPGVVDESKIVEVTLDPVSVTAKAMDRARKARESKPVKKAEGGSIRIPNDPVSREKRRRKISLILEREKGAKKGFPDLSRDGKITKKDILMGRGVIKKGAKNGKK